MPPKKNRNRRRRQRMNRVPRRNAAGGPIVKKIMSVSFDLPVDGSILSVYTTLSNLIGPSGLASVSDWYDEYRISHASVSAVGLSAIDKPTTPTTARVPLETFTIVSSMDHNSQAPTNVAELMRRQNCRIRPLQFSRGPVQLGSIMPKFDETGSDNHFVTGWLETGAITSQNAKWYIANLATLQTETDLKVQLIVRVTCLFRGLQ